MAAEQVSCLKCGKPFIRKKLLQHIMKIAEEKGLERFQPNYQLCQNCKLQAYAEGLVGNDLARVERVKHIVKRRSEKLESVKVDKRLGTTVYKSECFFCNQGCDAVVHVRDGEVVKVEGDPSSPVTKGVLCSKGLASKDILYNPGRLLYPMKRTGERGEGKWQRISWDEALDTIAGTFSEIEKKYGEHSVALSTGTSRGWVQYFGRFSNAYGRQRTVPGGAQCFFPRVTAQRLMTGSVPLECPHYDDTECMLIWGFNPTSTSAVKGRGMMEAWSRGAKMIVIDPMLSETASKADMWLQIRPGTDAALALGMLNVIINEGLYDREFVAKWCSGFDELRERARQYPLDRVAEITWIPRDTIEAAARTFATTKPASISVWLAVDQNADTVSTGCAITALAAITGNIDVPGGNIIPPPVKARTGHDPTVSLTSRLTKEHHEKRLGRKEYPLLSGEAAILYPTAHNYLFWQTLLTGKPYPIKALFCEGNNIFVSFANTKMVIDAITKLDCLVVVDFFMTPTAEFADIVLPAATWMERDAVTYFYQVSPNNVHLQQKAVQRGECWSDVKIMNELARKLGFSELMFPTDEAYFDYLLEPSGMTFREFKEAGGISTPLTFKKYETDGFKTPSGKIQLHDPRLEALGFDPLPSYREPTESPLNDPELAKEYPLIITTGGRVPVFRHSELRNIPILREIVPELLVSVNPKTARELGIDDGDLIIVESPRGSMEAKAHFTEGIDSRVVQVPSHWPGKNNVNLLMDNEHCAPMIGSAQLRCQLCRIKRKD